MMVVKRRGAVFFSAIAILSNPASAYPAKMTQPLFVAPTQSAAFIPKGSPIAGSVGSVIYTLNLGTGGVQNFGNNTECTSTSIAPAAGGNDCQYDWMELTSASGQGWAGNDVIQMDSGFNYSVYSAIGREIDINNLSGDYTEFSISNSIGILLNGLKFMNTAAVSVQTGNHAGGMTGSNGTLPIWYYGYHVGENATYEADFDTQSSAVWAFRARGAHNYAIDLADDNTQGAGIVLGNLGPTQGVVGRNGTTYYSMLYMGTNGMIHIGNISQANITSDGNILPISDNAYSLGSATQNWDNIYLKNINSIPVLSSGSPSIGYVCAPGAQEFDATRLYMCLSDSKWHTMAVATD